MKAKSKRESQATVNLLCGFEVLTWVSPANSMGICVWVTQTGAREEIRIQYIFFPFFSNGEASKAPAAPSAKYVILLPHVSLQFPPQEPSLLHNLPEPRGRTYFKKYPKKNHLRNFVEYLIWGLGLGGFFWSDLNG